MVQMTGLRHLALLAGAALLAGCAAGGKHCSGEFDYQKARSLPSPANVEGLRVPASASALNIPAAPAKPVPYAETVPDPEDPGDTKVQCLDVPRPMAPEPPAAPVPEAKKS